MAILASLRLKSESENDEMSEIGGLVSAMRGAEHDADDGSSHDS